jgi:hypothetical protein
MLSNVWDRRADDLAEEDGGQSRLSRWGDGAGREILDQWSPGAECGSDPSGDQCHPTPTISKIELLQVIGCSIFAVCFAFAAAIGAHYVISG